MAAIVFSRPGQDNGSGDVAANLLKVFAGEVIASFQESNLLMGLTRIKTVSGGAITWTFPVTGGIPNASYHTPGENILTDASANTSGPNSGAYLKTINTSQRIIHMDKPLIVPIFIDKLDEALVHWDVRRYWSHELGVTLARTVDTNIFRMAWQIASTASNATITGGFGAGGTFSSTKIDLSGVAASAVTGLLIVNSLFDMKVAFDRKNVPAAGRVAIMPPEFMKRLFIEAGGTLSAQVLWIDQKFSGMPTSNGSYREGKIPMLAGFTLLESNNMDYFGATTFNTSGVTPDTDGYGPYDLSGVYAPSTAAAGTQATDNLYSSSLAVTQLNNDYATIYHLTTNNPYILCMQKEALGTVKLEDLSVQTEYKIEYQGDVIVARMVVGHGGLRPECLGAIGRFS